MWAFWAGFFAGFFANLVFGFLTRLLPAKWVRYQVRISNLHSEEDMSHVNWFVLVHIQPPRWKRVLMEPLREYLLVQVKLGAGQWVPSKWVEGDINTLRLLADGTMSVDAFAFISSDEHFSLADGYPQNLIVQDGDYDMKLRIIRSLDGVVADEVGIAVIKLAGGVTAAIAQEKVKK